jgi:hypothetical protein
MKPKIHKTSISISLWVMLRIMNYS